MIKTIMCLLITVSIILLAAAVQACPQIKTTHETIESVYAEGFNGLPYGVTKPDTEGATWSIELPDKADYAGRNIMIEYTGEGEDAVIVRVVIE